MSVFFFGWCLGCKGTGQQGKQCGQACKHGISLPAHYVWWTDCYGIGCVLNYKAICDGEKRGGLAVNCTDGDSSMGFLVSCDYCVVCLVNETAVL